MDPSSLYSEAVRRHRAGDLVEAERLYQKVLTVQRAHFGARHLRGAIRLQQGRIAEALDDIGAALQLKADDAEALANFGLALHAAGRFAEALAAQERALTVRPDYSVAWNNRGNTLRDLNRHDEALASFDQALQLNPHNAGTWNSRGATLVTLGRCEDGLASYDRAVQLKPDYVNALYNRANVLWSLGNDGSALTDYRRVVSLDPRDANAWNNMSIVLRGSKRLMESLECCDAALRIAPGDASILYNRGCVLQDLWRFPEALASYDKALTAQPDMSAAWNNRGNVLKKLNRLDQAQESYQRALAFSPRSIEIRNNYGNLLQDLKRFDEAMACFDQVLADHPGNAEAFHHRGTVLLHLKRFEEALVSQEKALAADPLHRDAPGGLANAALQAGDWARAAEVAKTLPAQIEGESAIIPPFVALAFGVEPQLQQACAVRYLRDRVPIGFSPLWAGKPYSHTRPRIAYISADFRQHPVASHIVELIERHDRSRFELIGVSLGNDDVSPLRRRLQNAFETFHDVGNIGDREAAALLRNLEVDIAVDLTGHTQDARPGIFAHRSAPVQINYLGYPGTTGADFMDYILADPVVAPFDHQPFYSEKIAQLPDCFFPGDSTRPIDNPPSRTEAGLPEQGFVFCCFNNSWKIAEPVFDIWMRLLGAIDNSVLWLKDCGDIIKTRFRREASKRGIDPDRLIFAAHAPPGAHLARHQLADLFLDTLPYNAHATANDALWAGLPIITCLGKAFAGRVTASLLRAAGLAELVAENLEEYEKSALLFAREPARLRVLRQTLVRNRSSHPLFDTARLSRHVEAAYQHMLALAERGEAPRAFKIEPAALEADTLRAQSLELWRMGRLPEALASMERAIALRPDDAELWNDRGAILQGMAQPERALASYDRALAIAPNQAISLHNRAIILLHLKRFEESLADFDRALAAGPQTAEIWSRRGDALWGLTRIADTLSSYERALQLQPDHAPTLHKRGTLQWTERRDLAAAIADLARAVAADPEHPYSAGDLLHLRMQAGDWRDFDKEVTHLTKGVRAGKRVAQPFVYLPVCDSPSDLLACARIFTQDQFPPAPAAVCQRREHTKIRLGYMSGELREQATAHLMAGLFERHDRGRFEIIAFDNGRNDRSPLRQRLEASFDKFIGIRHLPDGEVADLVRGEEIDILVNLNGYFGQHRMSVFAHRPAPIQVHYLGFPGSLGADYMDYLVADRGVIPEDEQSFYTEKIVWLPDSYQVNDSLRPSEASGTERNDHCLPGHAFVFANFNQGYKLTPATFASWMRILGQVEGSVLWLLADNPLFPRNLKYEAGRHGIAGDRLIFAPPSPWSEHLARLGLADLFLDGLPYNAHTTASDALRAGLPLLTCRGGSFAGRVAASLLQAADLGEMVTENQADYETMAVRLGRDKALLRALRQKMAQSRPTNSLFDTDRFRLHLETAYQQMWRRHREGRGPESFCVR